MVPTTPAMNEPGRFHTRIREWPAAERPREKLLRRGSESLSDAELVAILLRTGSENITAVDIAKRLLIDYGSLEKLTSRPGQELKQYRGVGEVKAIALHAEAKAIAGSSAE